MKIQNISFFPSFLPSFLPSFIPSFLSVLPVEHPSSGWCFTDETVSHTEKDMIFFPTKRKLSPSAKIKLSQIVYVTRKQSWNKLKTVIIPNTSNWQLKIDGRRCQEIWKKKCLTFRFVVWKHPPIIFSSFPIWSKFIEGTITGAKCYLTKPSQP